MNKSQLKEFIVQAPSKAATALARNQKIHASAKVIIRVGWWVVGVITALDVVLAFDGIPENTWSELMRQYGRTHLILPWLCGVLIGHLFHPKDDLQPLRNRDPREGSSFIALLSVLLLVVGIGAFFLNRCFPPYIMTIVAILGIGAGNFLWPIRRDPNKWNWT